PSYFAHAQAINHLAASGDPRALAALARHAVTVPDLDPELRLAAAAGVLHGASSNLAGAIATAGRSLHDASPLAAARSPGPAPMMPTPVRTVLLLSLAAGSPAFAEDYTCAHCRLEAPRPAPASEDGERAVPGFDPQTGRDLLNYPPHRLVDHLHMKLVIDI